MSKDSSSNRTDGLFLSVPLPWTPGRRDQQFLLSLPKDTGKVGWTKLPKFWNGRRWFWSLFPSTKSPMLYLCQNEAHQHSWETTSLNLQPQSKHLWTDLIPLWDEVLPEDMYDGVNVPAPHPVICHTHAGDDWNLQWQWLEHKSTKSTARDTEWQVSEMCLSVLLLYPDKFR